MDEEDRHPQHGSIALAHDLSDDVNANGIYS